jgi:type I pantothenate kinase
VSAYSVRNQVAVQKYRPTTSHTIFSREAWAALRNVTPLTLSDADLRELKGLNDRVSIADVVDIYLPLMRLLELQMAAARAAELAGKAAFLGQTPKPSPYIIALAGSVAVGKSTIARLLKAMLAGLGGKPHVELVATDGFLHPTRILVERQLMHRKGFPESYDLRRMLAFLGAVRAGEGRLKVPVYSHQSYDIVSGEYQAIDRPDILIFEGLNVLQTVSHAAAVASDFFDFSVYIDADPTSIESWFIERFLLLQDAAFQDPSSYFHHIAHLPRAEAVEMARRTWKRTNLPNLQENIQPTRARAHVVIHKGQSHFVDEVWLRRY